MHLFISFPVIKLLNAHYFGIYAAGMSVIRARVNICSKKVHPFLTPSCVNICPSFSETSYSLLTSAQTFNLTMKWRSGTTLTLFSTEAHSYQSWWGCGALGGRERRREGGRGDDNGKAKIGFQKKLRMGPLLKERQQLAINSTHITVNVQNHCLLSPPIQGQCTKGYAMRKQQNTNLSFPTNGYKNQKSHN